MSSLKPLTALLLFGTLVLHSCKKGVASNAARNVNCSNARLTIINQTADTVHYCWGCNIYRDALPPGDSTSYNVGPISVTPTSSSISWVPFDSDYGSYMIKVDECYILYPLE